MHNEVGTCAEILPHFAQQNMKDRSYLATFSSCTLRKEVTFCAIMSCEHNKSCNPFCCISTTITQNPLRGQGGATYKIENPFVMLYSVA